MAKIAVEAKSRLDLRRLAEKIRVMLTLNDTMYFPIVEILELLQIFDEDAHFEIVEPNELQRGEHAVTDIVHKVIRIRNDVYDGACKGNGRDRMTIAHEFAHFITLCIFGFQLARSYNDNVEIPAFCDPEWQAKCLAGELMIPARLAKGKTISHIAENCGVSYDAAAFQLSKL